MLCQDCHNVADFNQLAHEGRMTCRCGGEWCGCDSCNAEAWKLVKPKETNESEEQKTP